MKKLVFLLLLPCFAWAQSSPFNAAAVFPVRHDYSTGDTLRVLTWNVEHLVDQYDDPYVNNRTEDAGEVNEEKMRLLAQALDSAQADILIFQEAESANAMVALRDSFFPDLGYQYVADARSRDWYQNVVILSKLPLGRINSYGNVHTPVDFTEDGEPVHQSQNYINTRMWTCEVLVNENYGIYLSGAHLKAGGGDRNRAMRLGQIAYWQMEMQRILAADPEANILLAGDLNSFRDGPELEALLNYSDPAVKLTDPLNPAVNTHPSDNPSRRLDYLLYNQNLAEEVIPNSAQVFQAYEAETMRKISDHLPIMMDIIVAGK